MEKLVAYRGVHPNLGGKAPNPTKYKKYLLDTKLASISLGDLETAKQYSKTTREGELPLIFEVEVEYNWEEKLNLIDAFLDANILAGTFTDEEIITMFDTQLESIKQLDMLATMTPAIVNNMKSVRELLGYFELEELYCQAYPMFDNK